MLRDSRITMEGTEEELKTLQQSLQEQLLQPPLQQHLFEAQRCR